MEAAPFKLENAAAKNSHRFWTRKKPINIDPSFSDKNLFNRNSIEILPWEKAELGKVTAAAYSVPLPPSEKRYHLLRQAPRKVLLVVLPTTCTSLLVQDGLQLEYSVQDEQSIRSYSIIDEETSVEKIETLKGGTPTTTSTYWTLGLLCFMTITCNIDHAFIPACLDLIVKTDNLSFIQTSWLGASVYAGTVIGTIFSGHTLQHYKAYNLLVTALGIIAVSLILSAYSINFYATMFFRIITGVSESFVSVFIPIWIYEHLPNNLVSIGMGCTQVSALLGTIIGYLLGGYVSSMETTTQSFLNLAQPWKFGFILQAGLALIVTLLVVVRFKHWASFSLRTTSSQHSNSISKYTIFSLVTNLPYMLTTLGLCNLFFVATGIQFWIAQYMVHELKQQHVTVFLFSAVCLTTAPALGVLFGSIFFRGDKTSHENLTKYITYLAGKKCITPLAIGALMGLGAAFVKSLILFSVLIWLSLFFGSSVVPGSLTMAMASLPSEQRPLGSAFSQVAYNILGWLLCPVLTGAVMQYTKTNLYSSPIVVGFRFVLFSTIWGVVAFGTLWASSSSR